MQQKKKLPPIARDGEQANGTKKTDTDRVLYSEGLTYIRCDRSVRRHDEHHCTYAPVYCSCFVNTNISALLIMMTHDV